MKIRKKLQIEKKQAGGIIYTPFVPSYTSEAAESSNSSSSEVGKLGDIEKEIIKVLQENGLPSDVDYFLSTADSILRRAESTGNWSMSDLVRIQSLANKVAHNKTLYDSATQHLTTTGNWNEVALNNKGEMYVIDSDKNVTTIDPSEYYANRGKYQALTNNDILEFRAGVNPFDSSVLNDMSGSIGIDNIIEYAKTIIMDLGSRSIQGYTNSEIAQMEEDLYSLISGGTEGYYKFREEYKKTGSSAQSALTYIVNSLPSNMRQLLRAKTAAEGKDPNEHAADLLMLALANHQDFNVSVDFDSAATKSAGIGADGAGGSTKEVTYLENIATGSALGNYEQFRIAPMGSPISLNVQGQLAGPLRDRQGDLVEQNNLRMLLDSAYAFQATDRNAVTFGSQVINPQDYDKIVWDNSSQLIRVFLPYTQDANGKITPNFDLLAKMEEFQKEIDNMGGQITPNIVQQLQQYFGDEVYYDPKDQQLHAKNVKPFLSISAYVNSNVMKSLNTDDRFLAGVDRQTGSQIKSDYDNAVSYYMAHGKELGKDELVKQKRVAPGKFYRGNVYIPIISSTIGVHLSSGQERPKSEYLDVNGSAARQGIVTQW